MANINRNSNDQHTMEFKSLFFKSSKMSHSDNWQLVVNRIRCRIYSKMKDFLTEKSQFLNSIVYNLKFIFAKSSIFSSFSKIEEKNRCFTSINQDFRLIS